MGYIYWVASYPKSGNTWMRSFLLQLLGPANADINDLWSFAPDENLGAFYQPHLGKPIAATSVVEQAAVRPAAQAGIAAAIQGFQFLKTHSMYVRHAGTPTIDASVTAGAIYIMRNPLDVVVSYSRFRNWSIEEAISVVNERGRLLPRNPKHAYVPCGSWSEHVESWTHTASDRLLVLRYEDLIAEPQVNFGKVVDLLGIKMDQATLQRAIDGSSLKQLQSQELSRGFREKPAGTEAFFRQGTADQWRDELTPAQIAAVVRPNRRTMKRGGYWLPEFDRI